MIKTLIKRDGRTEEYNRDKMYKVIDWATNGDTQATEHILQSIEMKVYNNMKISDLYNEVIQTAANNISVVYQKYDDISRNLLLLKLYKENAHVKLVDSYPHLTEFLKAGVEGNVYDPEVLKLFTEEELNAINDMIDYKRDYLFTYKGLFMFNKKYCKKLGRMKELPQIAYITAAMYSFAYETGKDRLWHIKTTYDMLSNHIILFATPRMLNSMKKRPQLASCVLNTPADDTWSLNQTDGNAALYSKFAGGLAWYAGYIRSLGSKIFANEGYSDGMIPQVKRLEQTVSTFNQQSLRSGAAVVTFPWWHQDVMDAIMLKDAGGAEDNRARKLVYSMTFNEILFERANNDEYVTLFDPKETPDLNELYGEDFTERYLHYEKDGTLRKTKVKALDLIYRYLKVRKETGNLYAFFSDNVNATNMTGKFVNASNLCQEITVPSSPSKLIEDKWYTEDNKQYIRTIKEAGEVGICNLASINISAFSKLSDHEKDTCIRNLLRGCDDVLDHQFYPVKEGEIANKRNRPIGIGIMNYAKFLAENKVKYTDKEALLVTLKMMDDLYYRIYDESVNLSIERGYFETYKSSEWAKHENNTPVHKFLQNCKYWLDNEEYPEISKYIKNTLLPRWDKLAVRIRNFGVRFSLHAAQMPGASSSKSINLTEGIEPIFKTFYMEEGTQVLPTIVPDFKQLADYYQICWDIPAKDIIRLASLRQMFMDQSQSLTLYYDQDVDSAYRLYDDLQYAKDLGLKTLYYHKTPKEKQGEACEACGI